MRTLIMYGTRKGFAKKCAAQLAELLEADVMDVQKALKISLSNYDNLILGSSIWAGKITKPLKTFIQKNLNKIMTKKVGLFICSGDSEQDYAALNFPESLREHAFIVDHFGGELCIEDFGIVMRWILRKKAGVTESYNRFKSGILNAFAKSYAGE